MVQDQPEQKVSETTISNNKLEVVMSFLSQLLGGTDGKLTV
jgi:hypothetical protein